jgi:uncharacterized membrane protein YsdA (DUF1294 family)
VAASAAVTLSALFASEWLMYVGAALMAIGFAGGTLAFFAGRWLFAHKKSKESFNHALYAVVGAQAFCVWYFWGWIWPQVLSIF